MLNLLNIISITLMRGSTESRENDGCPVALGTSLSPRQLPGFRQSGFYVVLLKKKSISQAGLR